MAFKFEARLSLADAAADQTFQQALSNRWLSPPEIVWVGDSETSVDVYAASHDEAMERARELARETCELAGIDSAGIIATVAPANP